MAVSRNYNQTVTVVGTNGDAVVRGFNQNITVIGTNSGAVVRNFNQVVTVIGAIPNPSQEIRLNSVAYMSI